MEETEALFRLLAKPVAALLADMAMEWALMICVVEGFGVTEDLLQMLPEVVLFEPHEMQGCVAHGIRLGYVGDAYVREYVVWYKEQLQRERILLEPLR